jgi:hypothetical protein
MADESGSTPSIFSFSPLLSPDSTPPQALYDLYDQAPTNVLEDVLERPFSYLNTVADVNA